ncbi:MAG: P-type conjugative transfer protein TrbL, partial [Burkholderiales bacterium]|nr:P-type conjugative transfer protein TrbL [Burkholderiales bacterium]
MRLARPAIPLRTWLIFFALVALVLVAPDVLAQDQTQQRYTGILQAFRDQSIRWQGVLSASARWLFFTLAIAQFAWVNMELALRGGDISDFIAENTRGILATGIMYVFLVHSFDWSTSLVMGFRQAGERAVIASAGAGAESTLDPAGVFQNGLIVAGSLFSQMGIWSGADNVSLVICALVLLVCFAFLAAFMALAIVESYIVIGASVLMLGFGGSRWTSDIAKRTLMYAVAVGAKLFTMQLIVGVAMGSVITWAQTYESDNSTSTLSLVGLVLLVTICAKMIPEIVQGILSGS